MKTPSLRSVPFGVRAILAGLLLCAATSPAKAVITTYTDRPTFLAALAGMSTTTETFDTGMTFAVGDNLYNGVNYRVTGTVGGNSISGGILNGDEFTSTSLEYVFQLPIFALGADFNNARSASGISWVINGITTPIFNSAPGTGFFGIISTEAFTLVDVTSGPPSNELYSLDNFTFSVPEPSTMLLVTGGLMTAALLRRRVRRR